MPLSEPALLSCRILFADWNQAIVNQENEEIDRKELELE
jgi:hypothetical protein